MAISGGLGKGPGFASMAGSAFLRLPAVLDKLSRDGLAGDPPAIGRANEQENTSAGWGKMPMMEIDRRRRRALLFATLGVTPWVGMASCTRSDSPATDVGSQVGDTGPSQSIPSGIGPPPNSVVTDTDLAKGRCAQPMAAIHEPMLPVATFTPDAEPGLSTRGNRI